MPLLQPSSSRHEVEVPKPLRVNKPSISVSSSSSSLSPQQPRPVLKPEPDLQNIEHSEPFRIKRSTSTTAPVFSPSPCPRTKKFIRPLATNEPSISTLLPLKSAPYQHRRLEISPSPLRPRLTPPPKEKPFDTVHRKLDAKTPHIPNLLIRRTRTYHITNGPATAALPSGTHVLITTGNTTPSTSKSSTFLSVPTSPFRDKESPLLQSNFNTGVDAVLPAPLAQTLPKHKDILHIPQSISPSPTKRRTEVKRRLTGTRKAISSLLPRNLDPRLHKDLKVINEKLKMTAQAVTKSGDEWRNYATFVPTRSNCGVSQGTRKEALNGALEVHRYTDRRSGESESVQVRDTTVQRIVEIRGLTLEHIRSRGRLHRTP